VYLLPVPDWFNGLVGSGRQIQQRDDLFRPNLTGPQPLQADAMIHLEVVDEGAQRLASDG
jgi:hypothetical protein